MDKKNFWQIPQMLRTSWKWSREDRKGKKHWLIVGAGISNHGISDFLFSCSWRKTLKSGVLGFILFPPKFRNYCCITGSLLVHTFKQWTADCDLDEHCSSTGFPRMMLKVQWAPANGSNGHHILSSLCMHLFLSQTAAVIKSLWNNSSPPLVHYSKRNMQLVQGWWIMAKSIALAFSPVSCPPPPDIAVTTFSHGNLL